MGNFHKGGKFGGHGFGDRDEARPALHKAVCTDCGKPCEVPFKPSPGKPVFCSNCFKRDERPGKFEKRDFKNADFGEKRMFEAVCAECGERCEVPFRPNGEKPVFCRDCFGAKKGDVPERKHDHFSNKGGNADRSNENFEKLNAKLDKIIKELEILKAKKSFTVEKAEEAPKAEKPAEKAEAKKPAAKKAAKSKKAKAK